MAARPESCRPPTGWRYGRHIRPIRPHAPAVSRHGYLSTSLMVNSIDDWPTLWLFRSSIVNCRVCLPG